MTISLVFPPTGDTYKRGLQLATVEYRAERWSEALRLYEWLLPYAEQQGHTKNVCGMRNNMASCLYHLGRLEESLDSCRRLILFARASIGDDADVIDKCENRIKNCERELNARRSSRLWAEARECHRRKDYWGAIKRWTDCLKYHQDTDDQRWQTMRFLNLSICRFALKQYVNADALMTQAQRLVEAGSLTEDEDKELFGWHAQRVRIGFESMEALALLDEYDVHCDTEDWVRAEDAACSAMAEMERSCHVKLDCFIGARVLNAVAFACYKQERYAEARGYWQQALRPAQKWAAREQSNLPDRIKGCMKWCDTH